MEIKQLKYFVVAADVGSVSEAAKVLYTTQSSVSKVIMSLEKELEYPLFKRVSKGIELTEKGKVFYAKASDIVSQFETLESEKNDTGKDIVRIGMIHSSFLANCFSDFYGQRKYDNTCFYIHADSTINLIERLKLSEDEVSFIYVFPDTKFQVEYLIKKYNLRFVSLKKMNGMVYNSPEDVKIATLEHDISNLRYIQSENDDYLRNGNWKTKDGKSFDIHKNISVVTNSDYVMHNMLEKNHLANLSAESFNTYDHEYKPGMELINEDGQIEFGYLTNNSYTPSLTAIEFIDFIRHAVETNDDKTRF